MMERRWQLLLGAIFVGRSATVDRKGQPLMLKLKGKVEAFYR